VRKDGSELVKVEPSVDRDDWRGKILDVFVLLFD